MVATDTFFQLFLFEYFIILPYIIIFGCHFYDYIWQLANSFVWFYLSISLPIYQSLLSGKLHGNKHFENFITNILYSILPKFFCGILHLLTLSWQCKYICSPVPSFLMTPVLSSCLLCHYNVFVVTYRLLYFVPFWLQSWHSQESCSWTWLSPPTCR